MKNGIERQIKTGYGDLRRSEKKAADYILEHMEQAAEMSIDRLAEGAEVSQPTVLRMLHALGFEGYKDFKYRLVSELAVNEPGGRQPAAEPMYGYTLSREDALEDIPSHMLSRAAEMLDDRHLRGRELCGHGTGSACKTSVPGAAMPVFRGLLLSADLSGDSVRPGCGGGDFLFRRIKGYSRCDADGKEIRSNNDCDYQFSGIAHQ